MTDPQHPITPPPELVQEWMAYAHDQPPGADARVIANLAAQWGADQELEACCLALENELCCFVADDLRAARRPKPPSLRELALEEVQMACNTRDISLVNFDTIRRALERLQELEGGQ